MKKNQTAYLVLTAVIALVAGILIGATTSWPNLSGDDLQGTIGRVDRYRNVNMTEDDIALRNELLGEPEKQELYKNYLNYYYIKSMRIRAELEKATQAARMVPEFGGTLADYAESLNGFKLYLDRSRVDILRALELLINLNDNPKVPVIEYLNQANNVIARMNQFNTVMTDFMIAIETFMDTNPGKDFPGLADAHDLLAINLLESALITQNRPLLRFLDKKSLANEKEGLAELLSGEAYINSFRDQYNMDAEKLGAASSLSLIEVCNIIELNNVEALGQILFAFDTEKLQGGFF